MDIVKQLNGTVQFIRSGVVVQTLLENVTARLNEKRNGLFIVDTRGFKIELFTSQIENTQLLPAANIKFSGGTLALWNILFSALGDYFFKDIRSSIFNAGYLTNKLILASVISPPILTSNVNDYNPAGLNEAITIRLESNATRRISGILAPSPMCEQLIHIVNVGSNNIQIRNNNGGSAANNRILIGQNRTLNPNESVVLVYDLISLKWRGFARNT